MNPLDIDDIYELSPLQQGMLFHQLQAPDSRVYYVQSTAALRGRTDIDAFTAAWQRVIDATPVLRTGFRWQELDKPLQIVHRTVPPPITVIDWRRRPDGDRQEAWRALLDADLRKELSLAAPPLLRLTLVRMTDDECQLVWTHHHLLMDGWSFNLLLEDVGAAYEALVRARPYAPPVRPPYRRYIEWLQQRDGAAAQAFWRTRLAGKRAPTRIAAASSAPTADRAARLASEPILTGPDRMARIRDACRAAGVTTNTLVLAVWALLLRRYSGDADVMFAATVSGRPDAIPRSDAMIGLFINTVPVRVQVVADVPVRQWLRAVQLQHSGVLEHADTSLIDIHRASEIPPGTPLFDSLVVFERYLPSGPRPGPPDEAGLEIGAGQTDGAAGTDFALSLCVADTAGGLTGSLTYDAAAIGAPLATRLATHFQRLLESAALQMDAPVGALEMFSSEERELLIRDHVPAVVEGSLHGLFEAQVRRAPDRAAVVDARGSHSYAQLDERAARIAGRLAAQGIGLESIVGLYAGRSVAMVAAQLGILKAGAAFLPLDPSYPPARIRFMIENAGACLILTDRSVCASLPTDTVPVLILDDIEADTAPLPVPRPAIDRRNLAYVLYTSGSTGQPKGIALVHGGAVGLMLWARTTYDEGQLAAVLATTSISYDCAIFEIFAPLSWGGRVILAPSALQLPAEAGEATLLSMLPSTLLAHLRAGTLPPSIRALNIGGEFSPRDLRGELHHRGMLQAIHHVYGPAEDTTYSTCASARGADASLLSIGRSLYGKSCYVLDSDGNPAPVGVPGELHLTGVGLARGYCGRPDLTADRFVPDPFSPRPGARMYRTGDLGKVRADGELELHGRIDRQIKIRGSRIEAGEVEAAIEEHPAVAEALVVGAEDPGGETRLVAYVVAGDALRDIRGELRRQVRARLPLSMVPAVFVAMPALPRMPNGKVDHRALPVPDWNDGRTRRRVEPRDDLELGLRSIWEEILQVAPIGVDEEFFDLGGHSLNAIALVSRIQRTYGRRIPVAAIMERATIEGVAELLRAEGPVRRSCLVSMTTAARPPAFLMHPGRGSVYCYSALARAIAPQYAAYGVQSVALDGQAPPHRTVEEMASHYLQEIAALPLNQPPILIGWCMGGLVAFEMARQWRAHAGTEPTLVIIDSDAPRPSAPAADDDEVDVLTAFAEHLNLTWEGPALSRAAMRALPPDRLLAIVLERAKAARALPDAVGLDDVRSMIDLFRVNCRAERDYSPGRYEGTTTVLRAAEKIGAETVAKDLGWTSLLPPGRLVVREVPGNHHTMLAEPHVARLADALLDVLTPTLESGS